MPSARRVAFVVHRYHAEIAGGAERHCREVARHMAAHWDVTVLTSCARDYRTWADAYPSGEAQDEHVRVIRFPVARPRDYTFFDAISPQVLDQQHTRAEEERWIDAQGPVVTGLVAHLRERGGEYDAIIFFTYLYWTTVRGVPAAGDRAWLVPTAHDEKPIRLGIYEDVFRGARAILYNTRAEQSFCHQRFGRQAPVEEIVGCGIGLSGDETRGREDAQNVGSAEAIHELEPGYLLYVGRVDLAKNCDALFEMYLSLVRRDPSWPDLVLVGPVSMDVPRHKKIRALGYVDEDRKRALLRGASVLIQPSKFESLSLVLLEAWLAGTPVLVNGGCAVLRDQVVEAGGGLYYENRDEFREALTYLLSRPRVGRTLAQAGRAFTAANYSWEAIERKYLAVMERVGATKS